MDPESGKSTPTRTSSKRSESSSSWKATMLLAYQSLGVVYGDLSISPIYVYKSTFADDITHSETNEEILGVLSFVFWTITLIPLIKYVFIVMRAHDNGEGGTFALYSLICRHADVSLIPGRHAADTALSTYTERRHPGVNTDQPRFASWLEKRRCVRIALLGVVMIGTCMVIGDGILTPAISVFSAVSGLELALSGNKHEYAVVPITCLIIVTLFVLQRHGTHRIGFLFAPVVLTWLLCISALGVYNIVRWNPQVFCALSPCYMFTFLKKTRRSGWRSLGGVLLCITGSEAAFADLGHFSYTSIQLAFTVMVYPALILAYMGQAAFLSRNHNIPVGYYVAVPDAVRWPVLVMAILASVVGSQAIISGTFSIISQSQALGCFPRVKVIHTSERIYGQIYIPEVNWILMVLCLAVTVGFRDTKHIGNASGLAVITVMLVTTCLTSLVIILCWRQPPALALLFLLLFGSVEALYFSSALVKFHEGAWAPLLLALFLMTIMAVWHFVTVKKYEFDLHNKVTLEWLLALAGGGGGDVARVPGVGLVFSDLASGVPPCFAHFVTNLPALHRVLVFVCFKAVLVPFVPATERYLVGRVGPRAHRAYRCIVRFGYRDVPRDADSFEAELVERLCDFILLEGAAPAHERSVDEADAGDERPLAVIASQPPRTRPVEDVGAGAAAPARKVRFVSSPEGRKRVAEEMAELSAAKEAGTAFILGHSYVRARSGSSVIKRMAVDVAYNFLSRNCRGVDVVLRVPPASLMEVGMVYVL